MDNGDDCDDENSSINPDGVEVCDGIDDDCDGTADNGTGTTLYADGDEDTYGDPDETLTSCEGAADGYVEDDSDCDDDNDTINPQGTESCGDGIDQDCDGSDTTCSWSGEADDTAGHSITTWSGGESIQILGDWDSDGDIEIAVGDNGKTKDFDGNWIFDTGTNGPDIPGSVKIYSWDGTSLEPETFIEGHGDGENFGTVLQEADVTGDGITDLLVGDNRWDSGQGCAYLFQGPITAEYTYANQADRRFCGTHNTGAGMATSDVNGDGVADWTFSSPGVAGNHFEGNIWFLHGPVSTAGGEGDPSEAADGSYIMRSDIILDLGASIGTAGDMDGDGDDEVVVSCATGVLVVDGPSSIEMDPNDNGLAWLAIESGSPGLSGGQERDAVGADLDDDGYPDLVIGTASDRFYIFHGPLSGDYTVADQDAQVINQSGAHMNRLSTADVDGDGTIEIWVGSAGDSSGTSSGGSTFLFSGPFSGTRYEYEADAQILGTANHHHFGQALDAGHDVNGDGLPDLAVAASQDQDGDPGAGSKLYLFMGI